MWQRIVGAWLIIDAIGSELYDLEQIRRDRMDDPPLKVHAVRVIRALIGAALLTLGG